MDLPSSAVTPKSFATSLMALATVIDYFHNERTKERKYIQKKKRKKDRRREREEIKKKKRRGKEMWRTEK